MSVDSVMYQQYHDFDSYTIEEYCYYNNNYDSYFLYSMCLSHCLICDLGFSRYFLVSINLKQFLIVYRFWWGQPLGRCGIWRSEPCRRGSRQRKCVKSVWRRFSQSVGQRRPLSRWPAPSVSRRLRAPAAQLHGIRGLLPLSRVRSRRPSRAVFSVPGDLELPSRGQALLPPVFRRFRCCGGQPEQLAGCASRGAGSVQQVQHDRCAGVWVRAQAGLWRGARFCRSAGFPTSCGTLSAPAGLL